MPDLSWGKKPIDSRKAVTTLAGVKESKTMSLPRSDIQRIGTQIINDRRIQLQLPS